MGLLLGGSSFESLPLQVDKGILGILTKPLDLFDAPGNVIRSFIVGELGNALKSLIPGGGSRRVPGTEVLGTDNFWLGLGFEVIADPFFLLGGIGGLTKAGKLGKKAITLTNRLAVKQSKRKILLKAGQKVEKVDNEILDLTEALSKLPKAGSGPKRKLLDVGLPFGPTKDIPIPNLSKILPAKLQKDFTLLASSERLLLTQKIRKLQNTKANLLRRGRSITDIDKKIADTVEELSSQKPSLIKEARTAKLLAQKDALKRAFQFEPDNPKNKVILDGIRTDDAAALADSAERGEDLRRSINTIAEAEGLTATVLLRRMLKGAEHRGFPSKADLISSGEKDSLLKFYRKQMEATKDLDIISQKSARQQILSDFSADLKDVKNVAEVRRLKLKDVDGPITPAMVELIDTQFRISDGQFDSLRALGVMIKPLNTEKLKLQYVKRVRTPEAIRFAKKNPEKHEAILNDLSTTLQSAKERRLFPESAIFEANIKAREAFGIKFDFFSEDIVESLMAREREHYPSYNRAVAAHTFIEIHGVPTSTFKKKTIFNPKTKKSEAASKSAQEIFKDVGLDPSFAPKDISVTRQLVDDLMRNDDLLKSIAKDDSGVLFAFLDRLNKMAGPFRLFLTAPFMAFHVRNHISNNWLNMMGGMRPDEILIFNARALRIQNVMRKMSLGSTPDTKDLKLIKELQEFGAVNDIGFLREISGEGFEQLLKDKNILDADRGLTGLFPKTSKRIVEKFNIPTFEAAGLATPGTGRAFGQFVENNARITHFMWKRSKGALPFEARASMNRYLFDYGALTNFEKQVMRPLFLFYTFVRKNLPLQIQSSITDPRLAAFYSKLTNIREGEVPNYLRGGSVFANPFAEGEVVGALGLPIEDLNIFNVQDVDPNIFNQMPRVLERVLSQLNPAVQIPIELGFGRDLFSRRSLSEIDEPIEFLSFLAQASPAGRLVNTGNIILDPRRSSVSKLINLMSGVKSYPVFKPKARLELLERQAMSSGMFRRAAFLVIPKPKFKDNPTVKQITKQMGRLKREISKRK